MGNFDVQNGIQIAEVLLPEISAGALEIRGFSENPGPGLPYLGASPNR